MMNRPSTRRSIVAFGLVLAWLLAAAPAQAQGIERIEDARDWSAFRYAEDGGTVCYMASQPKEAKPGNVERGEIYAIITHRPADQRIGEVSIVAGYTYKDDSAVEVKIGARSWNLFTDGSTAWAPTSGDDVALIKAMQAGSSMIVTGTSSRDTVTTDTYSLLGFSKAYAAINTACGL